MTRAPLNSFSPVAKWLSVVGIGEDGLEGLSALARSHLESAQVIIGGNRHLGLLPDSDRWVKLAWSSPLDETIAQLIQYRGQPVCVLASGDPMCYGIAVTLLRSLPLVEMTIIPAPSAFSLAAARLGWALAEVETLSLCGRDPALLQGFLYPGARILILSADQTTPATVAQLLTQHGWGTTMMQVFERMGGEQERYHWGEAKTWQPRDLSPLNLIALECCDREPGYPPARSRLAGLPDPVFVHDGQLTKQEVRAMTLAVLNPLPGQLLWDVGAGCGSISIEWLRSDRRCRAIAIEPHPTRLQHLKDNAYALGTPNLQIVPGTAPEALIDLPKPDAIFIGGGLTTQLLDHCWSELRPGGILVINAVTIASEQRIYDYYAQWGGELKRIAIQRAERLGRAVGWRALAPVTQWVVQKPDLLTING